MRVVLVAFGSLGDVLPFVTLARALRDAGHRVRLCSRPEVAGWVDLDDLELTAVPHAPAPRPSGGRRERRTPWVLALRRFAQAEAGAQYEALLAAARGADLLLSTGSQLAVAVVARALELPHRSVLYCPQMLPSRRHPGLTVPWSTAPTLLQRAGRWLHLTLYDRAVRAALADCCRRAGLPALRHPFAANFFARPIVACDPELAPVPADCPLATAQPGYLHAPLRQPLPADLQRFLDHGPPPVYLGFGSTSPAPAARLTQLVLGAVAEAGCRAVVARGWVGLGEGPGPAVRSGCAATVRFVGPLPHAALFPRVAAVVHHGGAGTTAAAARAGRPQVILPPSLYDQGFWRHQVVARGLGPWAPGPRRITTSRLAATIRAALDDPGYARRAAALGAALDGRDALAAAVALVA